LRLPAPRWAWALLALALSAPFWSLGHALIEVDDARYAEVPREMVESGDWATPTLNYLPYVEKPPLYYWLAAASYTALGVSESSARLPLATLAALGILLTAWLGSFLYDLRVGLFGAAALSSATLFFFLSHFITLDMGLTVMLLGSTAMVLRCVSHPDDSRWAAPAAWAFAGLAFLCKGLVGFVLPAGWVVVVALLVPHWRRRLMALASPTGVALFLAIAAPWFWLMEKRHPGFLRFIFIEQHFERYLTTKYNRHSPWYFFLLVLPGAILPWTPVLLASLARRARQWREEPADMALALWAAIVTAFFSASGSKLATYVLPVMPHLALLAARGAERPLPAWARRLAVLLGALFMAAAACAPSFRKVPAEALPWGALAAGALGLGLLGGVLRTAHQRIAAISLAGLLAGACALGAMGKAEKLISAKETAAAISVQARPGDAVWTYGAYLHGLSFYLRRRVDKMVYWIGELHYAKRDPAYSGRFGDDTDIRNLPLSGQRAFVVLRAFEARHFISLTPPGAIVDHARYGRWELAQFLSAEELPRGAAGRAGRR
jgi:4-amino-4-deoxy-L-arabinose transferase-like glycosyltransferase